ncbi:MAG: AraC family transcriptional regulator [Acutalibacteraceae bacterium]|nr:AraC family transcriptional regulator [Acutalibacteraceae bacterium]
MVKEYYSEYVPNEKYAVIKPAVEYIHSQYSKGLINISELSAMCGITPEYLRKLFRSFYGVSPLKYINDLKITRAKELLASGMYSVTEAALQSGYTDMSYISAENLKKRPAVHQSITVNYKTTHAPIKAWVVKFTYLK